MKIGTYKNKHHDIQDKIIRTKQKLQQNETHGPSASITFLMLRKFFCLGISSLALWNIFIGLNDQVQLDDHVFIGLIVVTPEDLSFLACKNNAVFLV